MGSRGYVVCKTNNMYAVLGELVETQLVTHV
jgi:hypothetical protein